MPSPNFIIYDATEAFLKIFSESLFMDLQQKGIKVQVLCPGLTRTDFHRTLSQKSDKMTSSKYHWLSADEVVDYSLRCLEKNKGPICIPGIRTKLYSAIVPALHLLWQPW